MVALAILFCYLIIALPFFYFSTRFFYGDPRTKAHEAVWLGLAIAVLWPISAIIGGGYLLYRNVILPLVLPDEYARRQEAKRIEEERRLGVG